MHSKEEIYLRKMIEHPFSFDCMVIHRFCFDEEKLFYMAKKFCNYPRGKYRFVRHIQLIVLK